MAASNPVDAKVVQPLWVEQVQTPYRLRHRRVNSLGNLADVCNHQRSFVLISTR
jgi:hypothetical protein